MERELAGGESDDPSDWRRALDGGEGFPSIKTQSGSVMGEKGFAGRFGLGL